MESRQNAQEHVEDTSQESQRLQSHLVAIKSEIDQGLLRHGELLASLETAISLIKTHQSCLDRNKDFTYTVYEDAAFQENLPAGTYIMNCLICNRTCHNPCEISDDEDKAGCAAMKDGKCMVCKSSCAWSVHRSMTYRIVIKRREVVKTFEDMKNRYRDAQGKLMSAKQQVQKVYEEYLGAQVHVMQLITESKKCLQRLAEIALKPDPLSDVDYIDWLIVAENSKKNEGLIGRIQQLNAIRELRVAIRAQNLQAGDVEMFKVIVNQEQRLLSKYKEFLEMPSPNVVVCILSPTS